MIGGSSVGVRKRRSRRLRMAPNFCPTAWPWRLLLQCCPCLSMRLCLPRHTGTPGTMCHWIFCLVIGSSYPMDLGRDPRASRFWRVGQLFGYCSIWHVVQSSIPWSISSWRTPCRVHLHFQRVEVPCLAWIGYVGKLEQFFWPPEWGFLAGGYRASSILPTVRQGESLGGTLMLKQ